MHKLKLKIKNQEFHQRLKHLWKQLSEMKVHKHIKLGGPWLLFHQASHRISSRPPSPVKAAGLRISERRKHMERANRVCDLNREQGCLE